MELHPQDEVNHDASRNPNRIPKLLVAVVDWHGFDLLQRCVESLKADDYADKTILVVENGMDDQVAGYVSNQGGKVALIETGRNLGYAGGANVALRYALKENFDYTLVLNNDVIVESGVGRELVSFAESDVGCFAVGPRIAAIKNPGQPESERFSRVKAPMVDYDISGSAVLIRNALVRDVGYFDENFWAYWEENDLFHRARKKGLRVWYYPTKACVLNESSATFRRFPHLQEYYSRRNRFLFLRRHHFPLRDLAAHSFDCVRAACRRGLQPRHRALILRAMIDGMHLAIANPVPGEGPILEDPII